MGHVDWGWTRALAIFYPSIFNPFVGRDSSSEINSNAAVTSGTTSEDDGGCRCCVALFLDTGYRAH